MNKNFADLKVDRNKVRTKHNIKIAMAAALLLVLAFGCIACSSNKTWYEDDSFAISGFEVKESSGIYIAEGTIKSKNGASSSAVMASVTIKDKNGKTIAKTTGFGSAIPENGTACFSIYLSDGNGFLDKNQVESISSYEISDINTLEGMQALASRKAREANRLEEMLLSKQQ